MSIVNTMTDNQVIVGRFGGAFGVQGWIKVQSFTDPAEQILNYQPWQLASKQQPLCLEDSKQHGAQLLVKLAHCDTPEMARTQYTNQLIAVSRALLPPLDDAESHYWQDLIGCKVMNHDGVCLGTVDHLFATPGNDVLVVQGSGRKRHLIPLLKSAVLNINTTEKIIQVSWDADF